MKWFYLNVALTYLTIGFAAAIFIFYVLKRPILGHFWLRLLPVGGVRAGGGGLLGALDGLRERFGGKGK